MYKFRFGKKRIIINSNGIDFQIDKVEREDDKSAGFSIEVDVEDLLRIENIFKLA